MDIQLPQIIFQIINFSVVMGALTYFLYKPVLKVLEERQKRVEEAQRAAEESITEKNRISELEQKAAEILEKARENAKASESEILAAAKKQAKAEIEKMTISWEEEKKQHLTDMKNEFISTVITTAEKVVGESLDSKKHQKLIDAQLKSLLETI